MLVTAKQPFGEWGKIFPDQALTGCSRSSGPSTERHPLTGLLSAKCGNAGVSAATPVNGFHLRAGPR
jgi:hypothetical protein